ncbi:hypothetical protein [Agarivorans sp. QJM3NY_25]|uniref:hypothetical protein n=1 Tax=Agarivorans sp. QJM3NY_25 TaxID=3421430 RepID=UPI003D7DB683
MQNLQEYDGFVFEIPDSEITGSCIDYFFDKDEINTVSKNHPYVPSEFEAIARDPGDDLILRKNDGSIYYLNHENGKIIFLKNNLEEFIGSLEDE